MKCPKCETELSWQNDFDGEDLGCDPEEVAIVSMWNCGACDTFVEIYYSVDKEMMCSD
jgi:hypothetical protein